MSLKIKETIMQYYETIFKTVLHKDLDSKNLYESISSGINYCLKLNERTRELHLKKGIKGYSFFVSGFMPAKAGSVVRLIVRCMDKTMMDDFIEALLLHPTESFVCQDVISSNKYEFNTYLKRYSLKTVSPITLTQLNVTKAAKEETITRIAHNLNKKYRQFVDASISEEHNPIADIIVLNKYPLNTTYKGGKIFGHKLLVQFKTDELSQKMAMSAIALGLGEKNSIGYGACVANNDYLYQFSR